MQSLYFVPVNFMMVFWVVAALHWKMSHHLFRSHRREMACSAKQPIHYIHIVKSNKLCRPRCGSVDLGAAAAIHGGGSSGSVYKLPKGILNLKRNIKP